MSETSPPRPDVVGLTLAVAFIAGLVGASLWIISPFAGAIIWAGLIVVSTWNGMLWLQKRLWRQRWLAVTAVTLIMLLVLFVPLSLAIVGIVRNLDDFGDWVATLPSLHLPPPPDWVAGLPLVGEKTAEVWTQLATSGFSELARQAKPYASAVFTWLASRAGGVGWILLQFLLIVMLSAVMYGYGESVAAGLRRFGRRLAGERGEEMVLLAGRAVRGVALGIVVTAFVQSVLGGIALGLAGVPFALVLTGVMFMLCIAQLGPILVLAPAVVWLWWQEHYGAMGFLIVCTIIVTTLDNVLRPILIRKGADLPLLLIFAGVIGGLVTFGLIGIFVGPVVLAVTYTLLERWVLDGDGKRAV
jgi:predicted PurR-regulated permease PerM